MGYQNTIHLIGHQLDHKIVTLNGAVAEDVVEVKRFPDGWGFLLSLRDANGNVKRWIDGQYKLNIFRGEIEISEAV